MPFASARISTVRIFHNSHQPQRPSDRTIVTGIPPFAEDDWKIIRSGNLDYHVSCRTTRCDLPNVDPNTGIKDRAEPYKTLKQTRGNIDKGAGAHPVLGMQMVPLLKNAKGSEEIKVGAEMKVVKTGEHFYIKLFQD